MLRLPWDEWGDTDVTLGMAAELHDQMLCGCGCGHWETEAHDPNIRGRVSVTAESCYVRQAIDEYVDKFKPGPEVLLSAVVMAEGHDEGRSMYEQMRERLRLPAPRQSDPKVNPSGDNPDGERD